MGEQPAADSIGGKVEKPYLEIPKCPECGVSALRPKCAFELGGDCPRKEVAAKYFYIIRLKNAGFYSGEEEKITKY